MIAYDLACGGDHRFEGWFASAADFEKQRSTGLLACPVCEDASVSRVLSVPNVGRKGNQFVAPATVEVPAQPSVTGDVVNTPALPPAMVELMHKLAEAQTEALKDSVWVGRDFAETARAIHYGEEPGRLVHGETSADEAEALVEEGINVAPLPFPVIPPRAKN
jgi:hypothetical protein